jgi:phospholipid/cholesterol/gamma-HCH transport system substrate-binding protein
MKISNETKVGTLTAIAITLLILGFNFLKGKNLFQKKATMYVTFKKVEGLNISDAVKINGLRVGSVEGMQEGDKNLNNVVVGYQLTREINIPIDSYGKIEAAPLGAAYIVITMGTSNQFLKDGDTIKGLESPGLVQDLKSYLVPTIDNANQTLLTIDSAVKKIGSVFDQENKKNLGQLLAHLNQTLELLNNELTPATGGLANSIDNINAFTRNLKKNNDSVTAILNNTAKLTRELSSGQIGNTLNALEKSITQLNGMITDIKNGKGTIGKLAADEQLYKNLTSTTNSLNILLQDLRLHPKRYVQVSVFGKKDKTAPLMEALPDSVKQ